MKTNNHEKKMCMTLMHTHTHAQNVQEENERAMTITTREKKM